jgi:acyl-coenzyme A synthetase/AMP-(fatty) acid ligase
VVGGPVMVAAAWCAAGRRVSPRDVACVMFTSGSTGAPKSILPARGDHRHPRPGMVTSALTLAMLGVAPISMAVTGFVVAAVGITDAFAISGATQILGVLALLSHGFRSDVRHRGGGLDPRGGSTHLPLLTFTSW